MPTSKVIDYKGRIFHHKHKHSRHHSHRERQRKLTRQGSEQEMLQERLEVGMMILQEEQEAIR